jgi:hypothetical protein
VSPSPEEIPSSSHAPDDPIELLSRQWHRQFCDGHPIGEIIDYITARVLTVDGEDLRFLQSELSRYLLMADRDQEALQVLDQMSERNPDDPRPLISKATQYLYFLDDSEEALSCIELALPRAYRTGLFRREALGVKARILLKLRRGEQLSQVLEEIMSLKMDKGVPDIGRERDFVDRAPPGLISEDVLARYNQFRPKRASDTTADEPPEWEPPDDEE